MIIGQSVYQLVVTFTLYFAGAKILGYDVQHNEHLKIQLDTIVFNTFVWMQIFNEFNNRRLDNKFNIFEGILRNYWFMGINFLMVGGQVMIIFVGGAALGVKRIDGPQWAICILCAIFCVPWAILLRCFPDRYFEVGLNFTVRSFLFFWEPIAKVSKMVFSPIGRAFSAIWQPTKRFFVRTFSKEKVDESSPDEEAPRLEKVEEQEISKAQASESEQPVPELKVSPASTPSQPAPPEPAVTVPPITLTTSN